MSAITLETQFEQFAKGLSDLGRQEAPFATARAITVTAEDAVEAVEKHIEDVFERPTPFTKRAVGLKRASKARPIATVYIKRIQAQYLGIQATGGQRRPRRRFLLDPVGARLNKAGNIPRKALDRMLAKPDHFLATIKGVRGVWRRYKSGRIKLMIALDEVQSYRRRFYFERTVETVVARRLRRNFGREMGKAIAQARRRNIRKLVGA